MPNLCATKIKVKVGPICDLYIREVPVIEDTCPGP